jgi:hypothetical protein
MTKLAILAGRKKFEEFAQTNPELPDDALAVANTLDTYPVRGAVLLIAGSLAHAADNVLRGSETVEQLVTHALLMLAGVCLIWVRHAISKHDVQINDGLQQARAVAGIATAVKAMVVAVILGGLASGALALQTAKAQTNSEPPAEATMMAGGTPTLPATDAETNATTMAGGTPTLPATNAETNATATPNAASGALALQTADAAGGAPALQTAFVQALSDVGSLTRFSSGVGVNLRGKYAPLLSQEVSLFGQSGTNASWSTGPSHATFFLPASNEEQLGWSISGKWNSPPRLLRLALFNARDIDWTLNWGLPAEDYYQLFRHVDWRDNRFGVSITRRF